MLTLYDLEGLATAAARMADLPSDLGIIDVARVGVTDCSPGNPGVARCHVRFTVEGQGTADTEPLAVSVYVRREQDQVAAYRELRETIRLAMLASRIAAEEIP